jgi:hypothetical protein
MRIRIRPLLVTFDEDPDPDPSFHFDADPDPSFQIKVRNLESAQIGSFSMSLACHLQVDADQDIRIQLITLMRIRIQPITLIRIRMQLITLIWIRIVPFNLMQIRIHNFGLSGVCFLGGAMVQPLVSVPSSPQLSSSTAAEAAFLSEDSAAAERCSGIEMEAAVASSCTSSLLLHTAGELRKKEPGRNIS